MKRSFSLLCVLLLLSLCGCNEPSGTFYYGETTTSTASAADSAPYKTALDTYLNVYYLADPTALDNAAPAALWTTFKDGGTADLATVKAYLKDNRVYEQSAYLTQVGDNIAYTYAVTSVTKLSDSAVTSYASRLQADYGIDPASLDSASVLTVEASLTGKLGELREELSLTLLHIDGRWYVQNAFDGVLATLSRNAAYR